MPAAKVLAPSGVGSGKCEVDDLAQQFDGQLQQDARAVTAVGLGAGRATVLEVLQRGQSVGDDGVRTGAP